MGRVLGRATGGAIAGLVATAAMSSGFLLAQRIHLIGKLPPEIIVEKISPGMSAERRKPVAAIMHAGYGAAAGAVYMMVTPREFRGRESGALFALLVWAAGYEGWIPLLGILPAAHRDRRGRAATILAAHLVFGEALGRVAASRISHRATKTAGR